jgi:uncharacterized protein (DUF1684 family)
MSELKTFRSEKDIFFAHDHQSPLTHEQKHAFKGLRYFPENPALRLEVDVELSTSHESIIIQTTGGQPQTYHRYGKIKFAVEGQPAELTIFSSDDDYFLPFVDSLADSETYPAGRYLEPHQLTNGKFLVDFNLAYNPYCAYNEKWSCPITPAENRLKIAIRAGEKIYHH